MMLTPASYNFLRMKKMRKESMKKSKNVACIRMLLRRIPKENAVCLYMGLAAIRRIIVYISRHAKIKLIFFFIFFSWWKKIPGAKYNKIIFVLFFKVSQPNLWIVQEAVSLRRKIKLLKNWKITDTFFPGMKKNTRFN